MPSCDVESGSETPVTWPGKKVSVNPTMDTAIGLADIQVMIGNIGGLFSGMEMITCPGKCQIFLGKYKLYIFNRGIHRV